MCVRLLLFLCPLLMISQNQELICGTWLEEEKQSHIQIYKTNSNLYEGKIIWLAEPRDKKGEIKVDKKNPNQNLQTQTIQGLTIIKDLQFTNDNHWKHGTIYDARSGKTYSLHAKLKNRNTLFMRGYIGISLIGKTTTWTKIK